jgi:hypothetical protein
MGHNRQEKLNTNAAFHVGLPFLHREILPYATKYKEKASFDGFASALCFPQFLEPLF